MGNTVKIPLILGSDSDFSKKSNDSKLLNLFIHSQSIGSKDNKIIINTSGLKKIEALPYTIYGIYKFKGVVYAITSNALYSLDLTYGTYTLIGNISINKQCDIADNGIDMVFVGGNAYAYNGSRIKDLSTETGFYSSDSVSYLDGYFIFNRFGTEQFFISKLYDTTFDPLMFASAESQPDNIIYIKSTTRDLWLFGDNTTEIWYDNGGSLFPFSRVPGAILNIGCIQGSAKLLKESIYFIGDDHKVYETQGTSVRVISAGAITKVLSDNKDKPLNAFTFIEYGHLFYAFTIEDTVTYVYDVNTMQWHNRRSGLTNVWMVDGVSNINDPLIVYGGKTVYDMSINYYSEDGNNIRREIISLPINKGIDRIRLQELQLDMDVGFDTEAIIYLRMSKDAGVTWSNRYGASTGKIGENRTRVRWTRLGQFRDATAMFYTTDQIPIRIISLYGKVVV